MKISATPNFNGEKMSIVSVGRKARREREAREDGMPALPTSSPEECAVVTHIRSTALYKGREGEMVAQHLDSAGHKLNDCETGESYMLILEALGKKAERNPSIRGAMLDSLRESSRIGGIDMSEIFKPSEKSKGGVNGR